MHRTTTILFLSISLLVSKCNKPVDSSQPAIPPINANIPITPGTPTTGSQNNKTFLTLGDSYTIGQAVQITERFPAQTVQLLQNNGIPISQPTYIAATGWTTTNLKNAIEIQQLQGPYSVVTLLIGVNDQYQFRDTTGYRERFTDLLSTAIFLSGNNRNHVFVLSIPDYSVTPFAANYDTSRIRRELNWFNDINRSVTSQKNCRYLDITGLTREAATDPTLVAPDGLHPSGKLYGKWAELLAPLMLPVLR